LLCVCLVAGILFPSPESGFPAAFEKARPGRVLVFPKDHGKHPDFQTEWWYFTGNLRSDDGREWGFQLTFFRRSMARERARKLSSWGIRDVYPAHFALVDVKKARFFHTEIIVREGPGLAESAQDSLHVRVKDWIAKMTGNEIRISARADGYAMKLALVPEKPVTLHGDRGYSRKGNSPTQASYYYSFSRLKASGDIMFRNVRHRVSGLAWMDHEFGSSILSEDQAGWDWFSIQLDDGTDLMLFHLRRKDGTFEQPFGTFVGKDGKSLYLRGRQILIASTDTWSSKRTGAVYPSRWTLKIPSQGIKLDVVPLVSDQELSNAKSTGIIYWEGAVKARGSRRGKKIQGRGYVELTGYADSMAGRL
jgi:predicted secreted hydrolase